LRCPERLISSDEDLLRFVAASFPSVWALELLLLLKNDRRTWPRDELVSTLRASELVVTNAVDGLVIAGLASIEADGVCYLPVNADVEQQVDQVAQLYRARPNAVRRVIVSAQSSSATAFADAFKLRRDKDD